MNRGSRQDSPLVDEMLDGDGGQMDIVNDHNDSGVTGAAQPNTSSLLAELTQNDRVVHADFQKFDFDFFNDQDLN